MSDLDEKLREILRSHFRDVVNKSVEQHGETIVEFAERSRVSREEAASKIKQAFIDAGWVDTKKPITGNIHGVDVYEVDTSRMTGQEWYDRFEQNYRNVTPDKPMADAEVTAFWAAKKAAGIES